MQTFANIKIDNIEVKDKKVEIKILDRIKTTRANRKRPILVFPVYPKYKKICPATAFVYHKEEALFTITIELNLSKFVQLYTFTYLSGYIRESLIVSDESNNISIRH